MNTRYKMSKQRSKRNFTDGAKRVHKKNNPSDATVMRGGIRL